MDLPTIDQLDAELASRELREFVGLAWPIVEPGTAYKTNWHIDVVCEHLEAVTRGELLRLVINIPPRHMKSLTVSVFWPAWEWLTSPERRWLFSSYAQSLATRDSVKCRRIIESRGLLGRETGGLLERVGYQGLLAMLGRDWQLTSDQNVKTRFENDATGYRLATSVGGSATGEGGDRVVCDDPHKADEAASDQVRGNVLDWWDQTMTTRLNDPATGAMVVIMQRLHEQDLAGHLVEKGYTHLCLPAEYEPSHPFVWPDDRRTEAGELLWPDHFGRAELDALKLELGSYAAAGQLQQRPAPEEGGIFKRWWWRYYDPERPPQYQRLWQSWDTALKEKTTSDYTVGQLWGQDLANRYLIRQVRGRWSFAEALTQMQHMHEWAGERYPKLASHSVYVENTAMGPELIAAARRRIPGVIPVTPDRDKVSRAYAVTPQLEAGNVFVPGEASPDGKGPDVALTPADVQGLIEECAGFPNGANDDQVDATTQALDPRRLRGDSRRRGESEARQRGRPVTSGLRAGDV